MTLSLPIFTFSFGLFLALLWLGIKHSRVFFVKVKLNVKSVQPFRFLFQLTFKGKRLLYLNFCGFKLCDSFRSFSLGSFQSGRELCKLVFNSGQVSQRVKA
jgi:hypothetical protein